MNILMPEQFSIVKKNFQQGVHAHAYLFFGGSSQERKSAAFACVSIATGRNEGETNPDMLFVAPQEDGGMISIAQAREIQRFLSFKPYFGKGRVVVVDGFERINEHASSALLKTLEEPPAQSTLILLSQQVQAIMPTILSRVQKVRFFGADPEYIDKKKNIFYILTVLISADIAERFAIVEELSKAVSFSGADTLLGWISFFRDAVCLSLLDGEILVRNAFYITEMKTALAKKRYSTAQLTHILSEMARAEHVLRATNANARLTLECITLLL